MIIKSNKFLYMSLWNKITNYPSGNTLRFVAIFVLLMAIFGLGVSSYLSYKEITHGEFGACPIFSEVTTEEGNEISGCDAVAQSEYSKLFGVYLGFYGIAYYIFMIMLSIIYLASRNRLVINLIALFSLVGVLMSASFVAIQGFLIGAFCFYCELSALATLLMFLATFPILSANIRKYL